MAVFLNIANRNELARRAQRTVSEIMVRLRDLDGADARHHYISGRIAAWKALFPAAADTQATAALTRAFILETGSGEGGMGMVECLRMLDRSKRRTRASRARQLA